MKFDSPDDIPAEWGNPNPDKPRHIPTRYVEWTTWLAGAQQWGLSSMRQGESSGTITHELGHFAFRIPDLNNNPYVEPYRRVAAGPWDMMDRGSFNGPGGPHRRWVVPPMEGAAMPAGLMLRNRLANGFIDSTQVLILSRDGLAQSGPVVARITARAVDPQPGEYAGIIVRLDGEEPHDRTPISDPATDPLSPGLLPYDFYTLEVVQRIGYDSFTPDNGVLLAKNRDSLRGNNGGPNGFNSFIWVIDAHPEDIGMVDFVKPNGDTIMRTPADYRQLNDALFHAGLDSGSEFEYVDEANRLHFYVLDLHTDSAGIRSYTVGVRSLDDARPDDRQRSMQAPPTTSLADGATITFTLQSDGPAPSGAGIHPGDASGSLGSELFRLAVSTDAAGWSARLRNALVAVPAGETREIQVYVSADADAAPETVVTLRATPESHPDAARAVTVPVRR